MIAFLVMQVLDGLLTYRGIQHFGIGVHIEGNPLLALAMSALGVRLALVLAKLVASGLGILLHTHRYHRVLAVLTAAYAVMAIAPWILLLYTNLIV